ncbi:MULTISPECIES: hypothetical protein [Halorussus]|uniref:hypothetical protein n=1 Tax=Halorussus TaxID=1070314 RepID=UPI00209D0B9B|nr:hypothetical protein [Halorussus vallis]USZ74395.1 hypothetical protein NGM07_13180 [Halorussus vallis]
MAENAGRNSKRFDDEIPTADPEQTPHRTIEESGWWRAHFLVLASGLFGLTAGIMLLVLVASSSFGSPLYWTSANLFGYVIVGSLLVFLGSTLAAFYGYYVEAKILKQSNAEWQPYWWLYVIATPLCSIFVTSVIYLFQRERHVGIRWEQLAIWR